MKGNCPEELLWRHLDYIYRHHDKMTTRESQAEFMAFDD
jgi:hypothetical protein